MILRFNEDSISYKSKYTSQFDTEDSLEDTI